MRILITGADGFIGQNLRVRLAEVGGHEVLSIVKNTTQEQLRAAAAEADFVFHLAGINRPVTEDEFLTGNVGFTQELCAALAATRRRIPIVFTSSTQAVRDNPYGRSKLAAEQAIESYSKARSAPAYIARLPNVFGKWSRPNYNSAVATFCHLAARGQPLPINDPSVELTLVYVDDVVATLLELLKKEQGTEAAAVKVSPEYKCTVGVLAAQIEAFRNCRTTLMSERVGAGLTRALYATYVSHLPPADFVYDLPTYGDPRGTFAEMLKTPDCGQFSFFTAHPGVTRGGHYHHSKTEKFLVLQGEAHFKFRHLLTGELHEVVTSGAKPQIVETIPGWAHDITNVGSQQMIVMLWANEVFDRARPDTIARPV